MFTIQLPSIYFLRGKFHSQILTGSPPSKGVVGKTSHFLANDNRVVATVIGTAIVRPLLAVFLTITLFTNKFVNKNMHTCFYVHLALQQPKYKFCM